MLPRSPLHSHFIAREFFPCLGKYFVSSHRIFLFPSLLFSIFFFKLWLSRCTPVKAATMVPFWTGISCWEICPALYNRSFLKCVFPSFMAETVEAEHHVLTSTQRKCSVCFNYVVETLIGQYILQVYDKSNPDKWCGSCLLWLIPLLCECLRVHILTVTSASCGFPLE